MFSSLIASGALSRLLPSGGPFRLFPPCGDAAWGNIRPEDREEILGLYAAWRERPYPMRTASGFRAFVHTGSRSADEDPYFARRRKLCVSVLACCVGEDALDDVIDGVYCISEETSWVISAHNINPVPGAPAPRERPLPDPDCEYVDLFSAQTGMVLSLTLSLLGERLDAVSPMIRARVVRETERRLLLPFLRYDSFWWMGVLRHDLNNWTPWILSNILYCAALTPMDGARLRAIAEKALVILDRWLDVVPADGGCDEGAGYWNMAGGALLDCLEVLETVSGGRMAFWQDEKLRRILSFPMLMELGNGYFANFADCDARPFLSGERLQLAGERLGDARLTAMGARYRGGVWDQLKDVPHFARALQVLFHAPPAAGDVSETGTDAWLSDLQVRIVRRGPLTLCCKGGHNGESHNHNDVGSFILAVNGVPEIVDAGNMTYTAKTFSAERYTLWNVRSAYHNLPLIDGREQAAGEGFRAERVECLPDGLSLDMAPAYGLECLTAARRGLRLTQSGLCLRDSILLTGPRPVSWVFMLRSRPRPDARGLRAGPLRLSWSGELRAETEELPVSDARMARSFPGSLWRVTLSAAAADRFEGEFVFEWEGSL